MTAAWMVAWLATFALHAAVLGLVALGVTRGSWASARPRFVELVWRTAAFGALLTSTLQIVGGGTWSPTPRWSVVAESATTGVGACASTGVVRTGDSARVDQPDPAPGACCGSELAVVASTSADTSTPSALAETSDSTRAHAALSWARPWTFWVAASWAVVALVGLSRLWFGWSAFRHRLSDREALSQGPERAALDELLGSSRLARVALTTSSELNTPIALGVARPEIVIPLRARTELDPLELRSLLAHELAHLERRDPLWLLALRTLTAIFWFQPLLFVARRRLIAVGEELCDQRAVERTGLGCELALCLTRVAEWMRAGREPVYASRMAGSGSHLGRRVGRLVHGTTGERPVRGLVAGLPAALGLALWFSPGFVVGCAGSDAAPEVIREAGPAAPVVLGVSSAARTAGRAQVLLPAVIASLDDLLLETRSLQVEVEQLGMQDEATRLLDIDQRLSVLRSRTLDLLAAYDRQ